MSTLKYNCHYIIYLCIFLLPFFAACQTQDLQKKEANKQEAEKSVQMNISTSAPAQHYQWDLPRVVHHRNGESMPYKIISVRLDPDAMNELGTDFPKTNNEKASIPVILFLHGAGQRGKDNESQIGGGLPTFIKTLTSLYKEEFDIIAPQCPEQHKWVDKEWSAKKHTMNDSINWTLELAKEALEQYLTFSPHVDRKRIYLMGLSMGGFGVWELLQRYPNYFAAAIPICGGGDPNYAKNIATTPVWAIHGEKDKVVLPIRSQEMVDAILKTGGDCQFTLLKDKEHDSWSYTFSNPEILKWLWSQRLK